MQLVYGDPQHFQTNDQIENMLIVYNSDHTNLTIFVHHQVFLKEKRSNNIIENIRSYITSITTYVIIPDDNVDRNKNHE